MQLILTSPGELVARALVVYAFLFVLLRIVGKKHIGELAPFDLVVLLILSETVQNAMMGEDTSLVGGLISAATLIGVMQLMNWITWRKKTAFRCIEGVPKIIIRHGHCCKDVMEKEKISIQELTEAMRRQGCSNITNVRVAILENDGTISVLKNSLEK